MSKNAGYNVTGAIFAYLFVAFALAATGVICFIAYNTDEYDDVDFGGEGGEKY